MGILAREQAQNQENKILPGKADWKPYFPGFRAEGLLGEIPGSPSFVSCPKKVGEFPWSERGKDDQNTPENAVLKRQLSQYLHGQDKTVEQCGSFALVGQCKNGHIWVKKLVCGREWCPECGKRDSDSHSRRVARWIPKIQQLEAVGYLVVEFCLKDRENYLSAKNLSAAATRVKGYLKRRGYARGVMRWHFFGDRNVGNYNPHLNILMDSGHISKGEIDELRKDIAGILGVDNVIVNYSYLTTPRRIMHKVKYVTRATFTERKWNTALAEELYNFRNCRWWGKWDSGPAWEFDLQTADTEAARQLIYLEAGICPDCGEKISWSSSGRSWHNFRGSGKGMKYKSDHRINIMPFSGVKGGMRAISNGYYTLTKPT